MVSTTPTTIATTPRARPPLPRYKLKQVDNSDLLEALNRSDHKFLEASNLVDLISRKPDQASTSNFFDSHRPTRVTTHEWLGTSLTITTTTVGRTVKFKITSPDQNLPHGLSNAADQFSRHTQSLLGKMGLPLSQNRRTARHFVNMVSIHTLPEDKSDSTDSSKGSVSTKFLHPEDEDYDLDLPPYPLGFSRFPVFPPRRGDLVLMSAMMSQLSTVKPMNRDNSANSAMPTVPNDKQMRIGNSSQTTLAMLSTWSEISKSTKHQALMWPSPWQT